MTQQLFKSQQIKQPASVQIRLRKVDFKFSAAVPYQWYKEFAVCAFLNAVTMLLPVGEQYFIDSVKHYKSRITDPVLLEQMAGFMAQEAMHSRQHALLNQVLLIENPTLIMVENIAKLLLAFSKWLPASFQLAITCALEHFTASFASLFFAHYAGFTRMAHPAVGELWAWHAVEEIEHKAVCFDVYQAVAGGLLGYFERCLAMLVVTATFTLTIIIGLLISIFGHQSGAVAAPTPSQEASKPKVKAKHSSGWSWLLSNALVENIGFYFAYFRPFFHPWQYDNTHLVAKWQAAKSEHFVKDL
jgi:predicted metal-dependent hydrolase